MEISIILFIIGLVALIKGGDWFVDGATGIAHRFHIPEMLIGATVVSIGTTLPEVMVSATSAAQGNGSIAYGNAIGSIICNTALIAAITIAIRPAKADKKALCVPVLFFFAAMAFYSFVAYFFGEFARWVGFVLLAGFIAYMALLVFRAFKDRDVSASEEEIPEEEEKGNGGAFGYMIVGVCLIASQIIMTVTRVLNGVPLNVLPEGAGFGDILSTYYVIGIIGLVLAVIGIIKLITHGGVKALDSNVILLILGAAVIAIGANLLVDNGTVIAEKLGVPDTVIALTFVALGTSLPELVTAVTALIKGHSALSLGNIIGANIFNLVLVSGASVAISPFAVPAEKTINGLNASLIIDIPVVFVVMGLMTVPALLRGKLSRWQGISLLCIYSAFCVFQFFI